MASSAHGLAFSLTGPLSAPLLPTTRGERTASHERGTVCDDQMPHYNSAAVRLPAQHHSMSTKPNVIRKKQSKQTLANQSLLSAESGQYATPYRSELAFHSTVSASHQITNPLELSNMSLDRVPLSAAVLERSGPSPHTPMGKAEHLERIGLWREGVANYTDKPPVDSSEHLTNWRVPPPQSEDSRRNSSHPPLSVVIPEYRILKSTASNKHIHPAHRNPVSAVPTASQIVTTSVPLPPNEHGFPRTAPLAAPSEFSQRPPMHSSKPSWTTSSTEPSNLDSDVSTLSKVSSQTSVDSGDDNWSRSKAKHGNKTNKSSKGPKIVTWTVQAMSCAGSLTAGDKNMMKSLPPSPIPGPEMFSPSRACAPKPKPTALVSSVSSVDRSATQANAQTQPRAQEPVNWRPVLRKASGSCFSLRKLDEFDSEFMRSDPSQSSAPPSPTFSEAVDKLNNKLFDIRPLSIQSRPRLTDKRSFSSSSGVSSVEEDPYLPRINVTRSGSDSSADIPPAIPLKSSKRSIAAASQYSDESVSPTSHSFRNRAGPRNLRVNTKTKTSRRPQPITIREESPVPVERPGTALIQTPITARRWRSNLGPTQGSQLPLPSPLPRLLSPSTPSARMSILVLTTFDQDDTQLSAQPDESWQPITPGRFQSARAAAETALLRIMESLPSLDDLANTSVINRGMRRVYKQNELWLLETVLKNESMAAWELREWTRPLRDPELTAIGLDAAQPGYTALTYRSHAARDKSVISGLKSLIVEQCRSFIRFETAEALASNEHPSAARFDEAFYRIWCYCQIFGSDKHREEDTAGQLDWLRGGATAHSRDCNATINSSLDFDMSSVLLNPPDHFGVCNGNGLSADELFDMLEIWNCLQALLRPYHGMTSQARTHGIFRNANIKHADVEAEAIVLEDWIQHILSLGPEAIFKLADVNTNTNKGFALAHINGYMAWSPAPESKGRVTFLRDTVGRMYEERQDENLVRSRRSPDNAERRELSKKRMADMAAEIRAARCKSSYGRLPLIDMDNERPMSQFTRFGGHTRQNSIDSSTTLSSDDADATLNKTPVTAIPVLDDLPPTSPSVSAFSGSIYSRPSVSLSTYYSRSRRVSPIWEEELRMAGPPPPIPAQYLPSNTTATVAGFQNSFAPKGLRMGGNRDSHQSSSEWADSTTFAIQNVVAMGFTPGQAREALRRTSGGDGPHVDRAVDWLLRHSP